MDSIPRKDLTMMTDAEIRDMRASVRGMPVSKAAALPIYDEFRNLLDDGGQSMARSRAFHDGAVYDGPGIDPTPENVAALGDVAYAYQKMVSDMNNAYRQPVNDNQPKARSVPIADSERAREQMIADMNNAYRGSNDG